MARWRAINAFAAVFALWLPPHARSQSADRQAVIWRQPQVRYLLADMTLGGNRKLYRDYPATERDPDSREAIRLRDAGVRVVNTNEFERRWVANQFGKDGRGMRVVFRGSNRTIAGSEVLLSADGTVNENHPVLHSRLIAGASRERPR